MRFLWTLILLKGASCLNILFIALDPGLSHKGTFQPVISALLNKGHQVTSLVSVTYDIKLPNYREILIRPIPNFHEKLTFESFMKKNFSDCLFDRKRLICTLQNIEFLFGVWHHGNWFSESVFHTRPVQDFIKHDQTKFDLILSELFVQEATYAFNIKYEAPMILISSFDYDYPVFDPFGIFSLFAEIPLLRDAYDPTENYFEILKKRAMHYLYSKVRQRSYMEKSRKMAKSAFPKLGDSRMFHLIEEASTIGMIFNGLHVLSPTRPKIQGMIDIGRVKNTVMQPLDPKIQQFLDDATDGVIYINFGSILKTHLMPSHMINAFNSLFKTTKMKILMKYEQKSSFPANVMTGKWFSQFDVLGHKNVKLFITHGGRAGTQEAIFHGVPMIVIPIFGDQFANSIKIQEAKVGVYLKAHELSHELLEKSIKKATSEECRKNIEMLSDIYKNSPYDPLKSAVFWIEYLVKYRKNPNNKPYIESIFWPCLEIFCQVFVLLKFLIFVFRKTVIALLRAVLGRHIWTFWIVVFVAIALHYCYVQFLVKDSPY